MMMLYWVKNGRYFGTQCSAPAGASPVDVPIDKAGLMDYLNAHTVVNVSDTNWRPGADPSSVANADEQRMLSSIERRVNLSNFEVESAEDFLCKIRRGNFRPTAKQSNLMDMIYDKAHRRASFRRMTDNYIELRKRGDI